MTVRKDSRDQDRGSVWAGLLIAFAALIAFVVVWPLVAPPLPTAQIAKTRLELQNIAGAAEQFRVVTGKVSDEFE